MADLLKKIGRGVKASYSIVKESVASPRAKAVYKETFMGAKHITREASMIGKRHMKGMKSHMKGKKLSVGNYPSVFEPAYVTKAIKKARRRKKKKS